MTSVQQMYKVVWEETGSKTINWKKNCYCKAPEEKAGKVSKLVQTD
jgi:hypothetical protein